MARGVNKVILIGNVGNDPDIRFTPNGGAIAVLSIATTESWKDRNSGQQQEKTEWHRIVIFGKLAEIAQQYLRKGSKVYIEGKLQTRKWQDRDGQDRYTTEIVVDGYSGQMQMLDGRQDGMMSAPMGGGGGFQQQQQPVDNQPTQQHYDHQNQHRQEYAAPQPSSSRQQQSQPVQHGQHNNIQSPAPQPVAAGMDDFDDDIPF